MVYKNLAAIDLKGDSTVQYTRNLQDLVGAACIPTIVEHPVITSYADDFSRAGVSGGFQSGNWKNIFGTVAAFPPLLFLDVMQTTGAVAQWFGWPVGNVNPPAPANTVAGAYSAAAAANNWHVKATFAGGTRTVAATPASVAVMAPMSFQVPGDPNPSELTYSTFGYFCSWISGDLGIDARFQFRFLRIINGAITNVGAAFTTAPNAFNAGSTWEMYCLCNNAPNPPNSNFPTTLLGYVDGVLRTTVSNTFNIPAGVPGLGTFNSDVDGTTFDVDDWLADELSD